MQTEIREHSAINTEPETTTGQAQLALSGSSLLFSILQSICTTVVAINGVRLAIGAGALIMTAGFGAALDHFHEITWLRISLMVGALAGSLISLWMVLHARHLRNRPAARWRMRPLSRETKRREILQILLSVTTLILVMIEEYLHFHLCHTL